VGGKGEGDHFVPVVGLLHFEMQYDGGTPEQETNLLPFVPIFRPSTYLLHGAESFLRS
jgi:hypothetical protein